MWIFLCSHLCVSFATIMWTGHTHLCGNVTYFMGPLIANWCLTTDSQKPCFDKTYQSRATRTCGEANNGL